MPNQDQQDFVATYGPLAEDIAAATGLHPSVVLGIAAQETGWGKHVSGSNIFGISPNGPNGQYVAGYPDTPTAAQAYVDLMKTPRYAAAAQITDPTQQAAAITRAGYNSVDPTYATSIASHAATVRQMGVGQPVASASAPKDPDEAAGAAFVQSLAGGAAQTPADPDAAAGEALVRSLAPTAAPPVATAPAAPQGVGLGGVPAESASQTIQRGINALTSPAQAAQSSPLGEALTSPAALAADMPQSQAPMPPTTAADIRSALAPAPNTTYGDVLPLAKDNTTGAIRLALPNMLRMPLQGLAGGPEAAVTINPATNALGITPEAASVVPLAAGGMRFSGANALAREAPPLLGSPPPVTVDELRAAIARAGPERAPAAIAAPDATGGPQSAGAAASRDLSPPSAIDLTPEQAASHRSQAEQTWLQSTMQPGVADNRVLVPGVNPTIAQIEQKVSTSRELKNLSTMSTAVSQEERALADEHNLARQNSYTSDIAGGGQVVLDNMKQARKDAVKNDYPAAFANKQPTAPTEALQTTQDILSEPRALENTQLKTHVAPLVERMKNITDPEQLYGLREDIAKMETKVSQAETPGLAHVADELNTIKTAMDKDIERGAPGYRNYMDNYASASRKIDVMDALLTAAPKLENDKGTMQFSKFHKLMNDVVAARRPGAARSPYQNLTDDQMTRLQNMHDDLKRVASADDLARAKGSDTAQNAIDVAKDIGKMGGVGAAHGIANLISPGWGSVMLQTGKNFLEPIVGNIAAGRRTRRGLNMLHPDVPLSGPDLPPP